MPKRIKSRPPVSPIERWIACYGSRDSRVAQTETVKKLLRKNSEEIERGLDSDQFRAANLYFVWICVKNYRYGKTQLSSPDSTGERLMI